MTKSKSKSRWQVSQQYVTKIDDSQHKTNPSHRNSSRPKLPKGVQLPNTIPNKLRGSQNELNTPKCLPEKGGNKVTSMSKRVILHRDLEASSVAF